VNDSSSESPGPAEPIDAGDTCPESAGADEARCGEAGLTGVAAQPQPDFCNRCGARWLPSWTECPHCARAVPPPPVRVGTGRDRSLSTALSLYFTLLALSATCLILILTEASSPASAMIFVSVAFCVVVLLWVVGAFHRVRGGLIRAGNPTWYLVAVVLGCLTFAGASLLIRFLASTFGLPEEYCSKPFLDAGYGWVTIVLVVCVHPAVIEELAFRGVILHGLQGVLGARDAVIVSALLFMVLHLVVLSFPHLFLMGLVLGYLRIRTGSLYPCMVMHFTHNLLAVLAEMGGM
jgi:membrane protease YdiL (CAAX protease family)